MRVLSMMILFLLLAACGTKGPLYIPEQKYPQGVQQPAQKAPQNTQAK